MDHPLYPPKNRVSEPLDILVMQVIDATGEVHRTCPNGSLGCAIWGQTGEMPDFGGSGLMPWSKLYNPLDLVPSADVRSVISGRPAVTFRSDDLVIEMTPAELLRFLSRDLRPGEYFKLRDHAGMFFEIHDDFYDDLSGEALQPMRTEQNVDDEVPPPTIAGPMR